MLDFENQTNRFQYARITIIMMIHASVIYLTIILHGYL